MAHDTLSMSSADRSFANGGKGGAMQLCRASEVLGMLSEPNLARDTVSSKKHSRFILPPKDIRGRRSAYKYSA